MSFHVVYGPRCPRTTERSQGMFQHVDATFQVCIGVLTQLPEAGCTRPAGTYLRCLARAVGGALQGSSGHGCLG
jgi:hypothetical protein